MEPFLLRVKLRCWIIHKDKKFPSNAVNTPVISTGASIVLNDVKQISSFSLFHIEKI